MDRKSGNRLSDFTVGTKVKVISTRTHEGTKPLERKRLERRMGKEGVVDAITDDELYPVSVMLWRYHRPIDFSPGELEIL